MNDYKERFMIKDDILHVHLSGTFPKELLSDGMNLFQPLIDACTTHNCRKALIDAREVKVDFGIMAMLQAGEDAASLTHIGLRIALLARKDMLSSFFDTVVFNRGGDVRVYTDIDAAREWLQRSRR